MDESSEAARKTSEAAQELRSEPMDEEGLRQETQAVDQ
jgi:hypothetical protein